MLIAGDQLKHHDKSMDSDEPDKENMVDHDDSQLDPINQEKQDYVIVNQHFCVYACLEAYKEHSTCNVSMCHSCYESKRDLQTTKCENR